MTDVRDRWAPASTYEEERIPLHHTSRSLTLITAQRSLGSRVATHLPYFASERIGCYHWGLVNGRTQTHLIWNGLEELVKDGEWHHDLFHPDGTPYDPEEIALFKRISRNRAGVGVDPT